MSEWPICIHGKYPSYISWETFERIQEMLKENYAFHGGEGRPGIPRSGAALLHGLVFCGKCGHQMRVHYKGGHAYLCNRLPVHYHVPADCQRVVGAPVDAGVVQAFFEALSPAELDVYERARAAQAEADEKIDQAHQQQLDRLRYQVALAQRQFNRVEPDNRLVAAELERRWEAALRELRNAEETYARQQVEERLSPLPQELKEAFVSIGQKLPEIWEQDILTQENRKALLRCLIDKAILDRDQPDRIQVRIVWHGGDATTLVVPSSVGAMADLSTSAEMEEIIVELSQKGKKDEEIAEHLTSLGFRSPSRIDVVLPHTVMHIRLKHRIFHERGGPCPRRVPSFLLVPQIAELLGVFPQWLHYRIRIGKIQVVKDAETGFYLFPDTPETVAKFRSFHAGECDSVSFLSEPVVEDALDNPVVNMVPG